jgi:hypothetical protein
VRDRWIEPGILFKRLALGLTDDGKEGRAIIFVDPALWPEPVNGALLLDAISLALTRYVVLPQHGATICALWIAHTYLLDHLDLTPRLQINSPAKQCGKLTLLDVLDEQIESVTCRWCGASGAEELHDQPT